VGASVAEILQGSRARLASTSSHPRRDAEVLLAWVLQCDQIAFLTHPERLISPAQLDQFENLLTRRLANEPIQYLTGSQEFFGLAFEVTPDVLIPRPETEHLVEAALERLERDVSVRIIDVGTGSGAIAVALAHTLPHARVTAVDNSRTALAVARRNAERHGVIERVAFIESDLLKAIDSSDYDMIVSNPPYVREAEVLEPQVANYEPHSALYAGPNGLEVYERLIPQARKQLKPRGWLILEMGYGQSPALLKLLGNWDPVTVVDDLQGIPRVVCAQIPCS
jgi:release factor glutamine methyltransferase